MGWKYGKWITVAAAVLVLLLLAACGKEEAPDGAVAAEPVEPSMPTEPLTLTFFRYAGGFTDDMFQKFVAAPVSKKYPQITMQFVSGEIQSLLTAGQTPDILFTGNALIPGAERLGLPADLEPLLQSHRMDSGVFREGALGIVKESSPSGQLVGLPFYLSSYVLYYNKDIFNRFGAPYPQDNMTWDELADLTAKVSRTDQGEQYLGLRFVGPARFLARGLSASYVHPQTNLSLFDSDDWRLVFGTGLRLMTVPGNEITVAGENDITKNSRLAMNANYGSRITQLVTLERSGQRIDWDLATLPSFAHTKGTSAEADGAVLLVSRTGRHVNEAFQIVRFLTTSPEVQTILNRQALLPAISLPGETSSFGADFDELKPKNMAAVFKAALRPLHRISEYDSIAGGIVEAKFTALLKGEITDVNTALRMAKEEADKKIREELAK